MKKRSIAVAAIAVAIAALLTAPATASAAGLRGSATSMKAQHKVAVERDLTFTSDADGVKKLVEDGGLLTIGSTDDYALADVSYPYAVAEVKLFVERLGKQYHDALGAPLVVTSLLRPTSQQPRNAHELSVHPAGMAIDFRVPQTAKARAWLESALLQLESAGVLDVTRERFPPHYHVAVFPKAYRDYVGIRVAREDKSVAPEPIVLATTVTTALVAQMPALPVAHHSSGTVTLVAILCGMTLVAAGSLAARRYAVIRRN